MPAYQAATMDGATADLASLRGKVVLLNAWATWCVPCRDEIPALQEIHTANEARGLEVVGVSIDAEGQDAAVAEFIREYGVTYRIWRDEQDHIGDLYELLGVPATFLIDREGVLRWQKLGPVDADDSTLSAALAAALDGRARS